MAVSNRGLVGLELRYVELPRSHLCGEVAPKGLHRVARIGVSIVELPLERFDLRLEIVAERKIARRAEENRIDAAVSRAPLATLLGGRRGG